MAKKHKLSIASSLFSPLLWVLLYGLWDCGLMCVMQAINIFDKLITVISYNHHTHSTQIFDENYPIIST
jgi:hypothetical protein